MTARPPGEPQRKRIEGEVRRFLLDRALLPPDGRLLLAVSGGPDSTALLLILARLARNLKLQLGVAYFDHRLRGAAASRREAAFVSDLACRLEMPFFTDEGDVHRLAKANHLSLEDAARRARYEFLASVAAREGFSAVATGHTASDQAETVLLHLVRGAGLDGLAGMSPNSAWPMGGGVPTLIRPLLRVSREQTLAYCAAARVTPLDDASNASPRFRRNRVRHELLPLLREFNPAIDDALVRLADAAGEDAAYLRSVATEALLQARAGTQRLSLARLRGWPASPRRHALRLAYAATTGNAQELAQHHVEALERLVGEGKTGDRLDLPRGVGAVLHREVLVLQKVPSVGRLSQEPLALRVPGSTRWGGLEFEAAPVAPADGQWTQVDAAALGDGLCVRRRLPGDRFQPLGMAQDKKLQDFFTDAHVPREERDAVPLFVSPRGIVWVGGLRIADWARPRPRKPTLFLSYRPA
ncbi:MAG TPA: tRNA lysidine(34) synthetase TilS [Dehalococcoidia bacterium]|nr:tRNA lysidine(34) synthetase TilS [Dehalococcoidia bacterium]